MLEAGPQIHSVGDTINGRSHVVLATRVGAGRNKHVALDGDCQKVRTVLDRIGEKWSILAIRMLSERPHRFNELRRALEGVTQRMLTLTLRSLERDGLVTRTVTPSIPPRVDYDLTPVGRSLQKPIEELTTWALDHHDGIIKARESFDEVDIDTGAPARGNGQ